VQTSNFLWQTHLILCTCRTYRNYLVETASELLANANCSTTPSAVTNIEATDTRWNKRQKAAETVLRADGFSCLRQPIGHSCHQCCPFTTAIFRQHHFNLKGIQIYSSHITAATHERHLSPATLLNKNSKQIIIKPRGIDVHEVMTYELIYS